MLFSFAFTVDEDLIEIHYHKDVKFVRQNLVNVALERGQYIGQSKRYYLVLKVAIASFESYLPFIAFLDLHSIVSIS